MNTTLGAQKDRFVWPGPTAVRHLCVDIRPSQPENHSAAQKHRNLIRKPLSISKKRKGLSVCLQPSAEAGKTSSTTLLNPLELTAATCTGDWRIEKPTCSRTQHAQINSYGKGNPFIQQAGQYTKPQQRKSNRALVLAIRQHSQLGRKPSETQEISDKQANCQLPATKL